MYERGFLSEEPDYVKAMEYYEKAAELDNVDGYCRAALYLANGYSGVTDAVKSREYYEKAAGMGSCFALVELSFLYENGNGVERSYEKAFELCEKAAQEGYPYAMFRIGLYLEKAVLGEAKPGGGICLVYKSCHGRMKMKESLLWDVVTNRESVRRRTGTRHSSGSERGQRRTNPAV